ncbi:hypothetical protein [uncultured Desulfosarcina sp.]|uniref:hypothetical protein n=1 Tax=uncultured Desulfosarcina sp. TaxID=218289 RepID=UPI0029C93A36|nr:hypothetical protein [uncultured Desulfosarcina sp.]
MYPSLYINIINKIEERFPVDEWTIDGINIWPLIRINERHIFNDSIHLEIESKISASKLKKGRSIHQKLIKPIFNHFAAKFFDCCSNDSFKGKKDILFVSNTNLRRILISRKWYDVFCDPLVDYLEIEEKKCLILERTPLNNYIYPRYRKSIYIQLLLERISLKNKFSRHPKTVILLEKYDEVTNYIKREIPDFKLIDVNGLLKKYYLVRLYKNFFINIINEVQPKIGFFVSFYGLVGMGFNWACREACIPSVDLQHGLQGDYHSAYSSWKKIPQKGYSLLPNIFWCWGDNEYATINKWNALVKEFHYPIVGGNPFIEKWKNDKAIKAPYKSTLERLLDTNIIKILITDQGIGLPAWFVKSILNSSNDIKWYLRLHPRPKIPSLNDVITNTFGECENVEIEETTKLPLFSLLDKIDLHITQWSSTVIEALEFGVPSIIIHEFGEELFKKYIQTGDVSYVSNQKELFFEIMNLKKRIFKKQNYKQKSKRALQALVRNYLPGAV